MTKGDKLVIGVTLLILVALATWQALDAQKEESRDPFLPTMSTLSALPSGSKAAYLVLEEIGRNPVRWGRSFAQLSGRRGALITFGASGESSTAPPIDALETQSLLDWVADGNTLLAFGDGARALFEMRTEATDAAEKSTGAGALAGLSFVGCDAKFLDAEKDDKVIIAIDSGAFAVERVVGKGKAYLFASDSVLRNEMLGEVDNAAILTLAPAAATVFLDDFHRGHIASGSPLELLPKPLSTALLLCLFIGAVAIAKQSFHFGPLREGEPRKLRSGAEIAWSLSRLLRQAGASSTAAKEMVRAFKMEFGLPQDAPIESAFTRIGGEHEDLKAKAGEFDSAIERGGVGSKQLAELTTLLADIRRLIRDQSKGR